MKKNLFLIAALLAFIFIVPELSSATKTTIVIGKGGSLKWNGKVGSQCKCEDGGKNCYIYVQKKYSEVTIGNDGNYYLKLTIEEMDASISPDDGQSFTQSISPQNYTFPDNTIVTINHSDEYPNLNGKQIDISNLTTDQNGEINVLIP